jgi:hypothetical protein
MTQRGVEVQPQLFCLLHYVGELSASRPGCCMHVEGASGICLAAVDNDEEKSLSATNYELLQPVT